VYGTHAMNSTDHSDPLTMVSARTPSLRKRKNGRASSTQKKRRRYSDALSSETN
jgi:hypothetical protein